MANDNNTQAATKRPDGKASVTGVLDPTLDGADSSDAQPIHGSWVKPYSEEGKARRAERSNAIRQSVATTALEGFSPLAIRRQRRQHNKCSVKDDDVKEVQNQKDLWTRRIMNALVTAAFKGPPDTRGRTLKSAGTVANETDTAGGEATGKGINVLNEEQKQAYRRWQEDHLRNVEEKLELPRGEQEVEKCATLIVADVVEAHEHGFHPSSHKINTALTCSARLRRILAVLKEFTIIRYDCFQSESLADLIGNPDSYASRKESNHFINQGKKKRSGATDQPGRMENIKKPPTHLNTHRLHTVEQRNAWVTGQLWDPEWQAAHDSPESQQMQADADADADDSTDADDEGAEQTDIVASDDEVEIDDTDMMNPDMGVTTMEYIDVPEGHHDTASEGSNEDGNSEDDTREDDDDDDDSNGNGAPITRPGKRKLSQQPTSSPKRLRGHSSQDGNSTDEDAPGSPDDAQDE